MLSDTLLHSIHMAGYNETTDFHFSVHEMTLFISYPDSVGSIGNYY